MTLWLFKSKWKKNVFWYYWQLSSIFQSYNLKDINWYLKVYVRDSPLGKFVWNFTVLILPVTALQKTFFLFFGVIYFSYWRFYFFFTFLPFFISIHFYKFLLFLYVTSFHSHQEHPVRVPVEDWLGLVCWVCAVLNNVLRQNVVFNLCCFHLISLMTGCLSVYLSILRFFSTLPG